MSVLSGRLPSVVKYIVVPKSAVIVTLIGLLWIPAAGENTGVVE